jgi:4-amino-4-deoxy-L-arabinose transferase-like glycosyltransferase
MEFLGDQGRDVTIIKDFWQKGNLFFIGPQTSIGNMYLGPWFYYLIAPSLLLANFNPVGPAIFIALINIATIYLIYFVAKKWFSQTVGLISAFLFAISPVVIKYSNFIWNPNIMPFFALLFIYFFFEGLFTKKYRYFIYASLSFVMVFNSHYLGLALLPLPGLYWLIELIKFIKLKSKYIKTFLFNTSFAFFAFFTSLIPQILFDIKHQGQNIKALLTFFTQRENNTGGTVNLKIYKAIPKLPSIFNQVVTDLLAGRNLTVGLIISIIFSFLIIFYCIYLYRKQKLSKYFLAVFLIFLSGLIALALYKQHIYAHYFAFLFPLVFILIAIIINRFRFIGIPLILIISYFSILKNPLRYPPNHQLKTVSDISDLIINNSSNQEFNFALLAKQNYDPPYRYILSNKKAKIVNLPATLTEQLFVVCEPFQIDCNPINNPEWAVAAFGWAKIDQQWEIDGIKIFKLIHP